MARNPKYLQARRFSKSMVLMVIDSKINAIVQNEKFDRNNGTVQLTPKGCSEAECAHILRAVEYGRMRALEAMAESICEGFRFDE